MNTFALTLNPTYGRSITLRFSGPSAWGELTDEQSIALMRVRAKVDTRPETLFAALRLLYRIKPRHLRWLFDSNYLRSQRISPDNQLLLLEQGQNLLRTLDWIGEVDPEASFPVCFRWQDFHYGNPLILLERRFGDQTRYYGPQAGLGNCGFDEFMAADKAHRENDLPRLTAILYRPLDPLTGERELFDHSTMKDRSAFFAKLDPALLDRIRFGFGCTMLNLQKIFRLVFPKNWSEEEVNAGKSDKKAGNWLDVVLGLAKLDVTKVAQIERVNLYLALKVLDEQLRQAAEMDAQMEKMKQKS